MVVNGNESIEIPQSCPLIERYRKKITMQKLNVNAGMILFYRGYFNPANLLFEWHSIFTNDAASY